MTVRTLLPADAQVAIAAGARLIDIRGADEHLRERIPGAINLPLAHVHALAPADSPVIFHCRSGMRTAANAAQLEAAAGRAPVYLLDGGIDAWRKAGLVTVADRSQPIEIMRQVQIAAGLLILAGLLLGTFVASGFLFVSVFVGAGLIFAGATGWCGLAKLLGAMPWNRRAGA
jgi:rhodanese-related sulfurtransferase